jgi:hypothetical protein
MPQCAPIPDVNCQKCELKVGRKSFISVSLGRGKLLMETGAPYRG